MWCDAFITIVLSDEPRQNQGRGLVDHKLVKVSQKFLLLAVPRRLFCFGSLVILDVARCYLWLFTLYLNIKIGKRLNVRLAGDYLYGKLLFTWLSLVMSMMVSFLFCPFSHEVSWMRS